MPTELINHPQHYNNAASECTRDILLLFVSSEDFETECIEVIEKYKLNFHIGNAIKYLWRCDFKGSKESDLKKALWYFERYRDQKSDNSIRLSFTKRSNNSNLETAITLIKKILNETSC